LCFRAYSFIFYRNKLEFSFSTKRWLSPQEISSGEVFDQGALGFHAPGLFSKVVDIDTCYLQKDPSNQIRQKIKEYALKHNLSYYNTKEHQGLLRNLIIRTTTTGQTMVILQFGQFDKDKINPLLKSLLKDLPEITTLMYVVNTKKNESFFDLTVINFHGPGYILEELNIKGSKPLQFRIGPKSFFQTNSEQANQLFGKVLELADLKGNEFVLDLYTGTGTIASLVSSQAERVIGLDNVSEAIEKARINAAQNQLTNLEFICGDIKDTLTDDFFEQNGKPDLVIVDPPRAGLHPNLIKKSLDIKPSKILYVSCNPSTQARDISFLVPSYKIIEIQPVDMFPHTHHVENIVRLELEV